MMTAAFWFIAGILCGVLLSAAYGQAKQADRLEALRGRGRPRR